MKYVITGGAGFIGSHLCEALVDRGHNLIIIDNLSSGDIKHLYQIRSHPSITFYQDTILNRSALMNYFQSVDGVFHLAAMVSVPRSIQDPYASHLNTLTGSLTVLLAARDAGVKRVVSASSAAVYGNIPDLPKREDMPVNPLSPYAVEKHAVEEYSRIFSELYGLSTVCLRFFNVYGPRQDPYSDYAAAVPRIINRVMQGDPPVIYGDGEQTRDFVYVKDVVQANIKAMEGEIETGVYNIASGQGTSLNILSMTILKVLDSVLHPVYEKARSGEVMHSVADISKARRTIGYKPEYSLEQGIREMVRIMRSDCEE